MAEPRLAPPAGRHHNREGDAPDPGRLQTGNKYGMQTMDAALADLVRGGSITASWR